MSKQYPIIAVTGSSGSGTSAVKETFCKMFQKHHYKVSLIEGDCFHRYDRSTMDKLMTEATKNNQMLTHFGPEGNLFNKLEALFKQYAENGSGQKRFYIHNEAESAQHEAPLGTLTPWEDIETDTDLLFYEGLHGGLITADINVAQYVDLLIGETPIINLEWMQKIHRDHRIRGYTTQNATELILSRMHDYVHYITPQFSHTDINFQRVPTVDTSNPFDNKAVPSNDESFCVIHIRNQEKIPVDFSYLLAMLAGAMMSNPNTIVVPAAKKVFAMNLILLPVIKKLIAQKN